MRFLPKISLLLVLAAFLGSSDVYAQQVGNCALGSANKDLDGNNIRARLYNAGNLFWRGSGNVYTVPIGGEANAIFASGIWLGGLDDNGNIRFAGTTYGPFEYWPGPLDANGNPPADCSIYDRIWKITRSDLDRLDLQGQATQDIEEWPWDLGAPVVDGDGDPNNYNLAGGDRPELIGEQTAWWIMNDVGGVKEWSNTPPIGVEVQVTAFAFRTADALNNTTFYKYKIINKGQQGLNQAYFSIWTDPDLGNAADDFVGSDPTLGLGYVYNGTDNDQGFDGYGTTPPALAYDFFQGPLVPSPGDTWMDPDGTVHQDATRLSMTSFVYYNNDATVQGDPCRGGGCPQDPYNYQRARWRDGSEMTIGGSGIGGTETTTFIFPGDPVTRSFWSEENIDGTGARNTPADRRFLMTSGPFTVSPGDVQEIVFGIVWSRSVNRLASVAQLRFDDILAQGAFNNNFSIPPPPDAPEVAVGVNDGQVVLEWDYNANSNNFLNKYDEPSAFLVDQTPLDGNVTFTFEGYRVIEYANAFDQEGRVIATYDVNNGVKGVTDQALDINTGQIVTNVTADGNDGGSQNFHVIRNLTNYQDLYYGVQAYAYNPNSLPKVYAGPVTRVKVTPRRQDALNGGTLIRGNPLTDLLSNRTAGTGDPFGVFATISNPGAITGGDYTVSIYDAVEALGEDSLQIGGEYVTSLLTYDIAGPSGKVVDGAGFVRNNGKNVPFGTNILSSEGLSFSVDTSPPDFTDFSVVANASGPVSEPGALNFAGFPVAANPGATQQATGDGQFFLHTGDNGTRGGYDAFVPRVNNGNWDSRVIIPYDFEIRFTAEGSLAYDAFCTGTVFRVPFELWRIGSGTPDDPSDDVRMVPYLLDNDWNGVFNFNSTASIQDAVDRLGPDLAPCGSGSADHSASGANNDPFTDWIYWATPTDDSPGDAGYRAWEAAAASITPDDAFYGVLATDNSIRRMVIGNWNGGDVDAASVDGTGYNQDMPEEGTVFRIITSKPLAKGDVFAISSSGFEPVRGDATTAQAALDQIGIVPNPYKGASAYEINLSADEVRFTNLPERATVRVFNLAGQLIRTMDLGAANNRWDLENDDGIPIASGMYLIHIEVPGVGDKVIKFGAIMSRVQLDLF